MASLEGNELGKYRVLEALGRGGMARVYRAYHPQLDRYVAIKVLRSDLLEEGDVLVRFQREARAIAALRHPNVIQVFDFDVEGETYYMVMELIEGDTLKGRLNDYRVQGRRLAWGEIVRIMLDVLDGLAYAHSEGMIHRDIKPANVLLTGQGQAVLADFGIAQIVGATRHTATGALMGTLDYMAPEQGMEGRSDARSDLYSLGIVLYEMLTQRTPFEADTPLAVLMKHVNDPLPLPRHIDPEIPVPFERVVLKALTKDPDGRYQTAEEMAQALRQAAEEAEIELPQRISLPLSLTPSGMPSDSVAVFSGTARERLEDVGFADDDTDAALGQKLAAAGPGEESMAAAGKQLLGAVGSLGRLIVNKTTQALQEAIEAVEEGEEEDVASDRETIAFDPADDEGEMSAVQPDGEDAQTAILAAQETASFGPEDTEDQVTGRVEVRAGEEAQPDADPTPDRPAVKESKGGKGFITAVLGAFALLLLGNAFMLTVAGVTGWWEIYGRGWPIELFLLAAGLFGVMYVTRSIWLLIPAGILFGHGLIFSYCSITGWWHHWVFLWIVELWMVPGVIVTTIVLAKEGPSRYRPVSYVLARMLGPLSVVLAILVGCASAFIGLFSSGPLVILGFISIVFVGLILLLVYVLNQRPATAQSTF